MQDIEAALADIQTEYSQIGEGLKGVASRVMALLDERGLGELIRWHVATELRDKAQPAALLQAPPAEAEPPPRKPRSRFVRREAGKACSVQGCGRKHTAKGLCSLHYGRQRAGRRQDGTPEKPASKAAATFSETFKRNLLAEVLKTKPGSQERRRAMAKVINAEHTMPDGSRSKLGKTTLYVWAKQLGE